MPPKRPIISFVVAMDENRVIGANGRLPWRLPADMRRFRELTIGHPVLMGRKTYESLPKRFRPLPGRENIILTRQSGYDAPGCQVYHTLEDALAALTDAQEVMVIGGAELFEQLLPLADRLYLTLVHGRHAGDVFFPPLDEAAWAEVSREKHPADAEHALSFSFVTVERARGSSSLPVSQSAITDS